MHSAIEKCWPKHLLIKWAFVYFFFITFVSIKQIRKFSYLICSCMSRLTSLYSLKCSGMLILLNDLYQFRLVFYMTHNRFKIVSIKAINYYYFPLFPMSSLKNKSFLPLNWKQRKPSYLWICSVQQSPSCMARS